MFLVMLNRPTAARHEVRLYRASGLTFFSSHSSRLLRCTNSILQQPHRPSSHFIYSLGPCSIRLDLALLLLIVPRLLHLLLLQSSSPRLLRRPRSPSHASIYLHLQPSAALKSETFDPSPTLLPCCTLLLFPDSHLRIPYRQLNPPDPRPLSVFRLSFAAVLRRSTMPRLRR